MVSGPGRLCTINLSVENSTYLKHLLPAEGKKHQCLFHPYSPPTPKHREATQEPCPLASAAATRKEHQEIQRGRETEAAEGSSQTREGFNVEKGMRNCKRKRKKRREVAGNKESSWQ